MPSSSESHRNSAFATLTEDTIFRPHITDDLLEERPIMPDIIEEFVKAIQGADCLKTMVDSQQERDSIARYIEQVVAVKTVETIKHALLH